MSKKAITALALLLISIGQSTNAQECEGASAQTFSCNNCDFYFSTCSANIQYVWVYASDVNWSGIRCAIRNDDCSGLGLQHCERTNIVIPYKCPGDDTYKTASKLACCAYAAET